MTCFRSWSWSTQEISAPRPKLTLPLGFDSLYLLTNCCINSFTANFTLPYEYSSVHLDPLGYETLTDPIRLNRDQVRLWVPGEVSFPQNLALWRPLKQMHAIPTTDLLIHIHASLYLLNPPQLCASVSLQTSLCAVGSSMAIRWKSSAAAYLFMYMFMCTCVFVFRQHINRLSFQAAMHQPYFPGFSVRFYKAAETAGQLSPSGCFYSSQ